MPARKIAILGGGVGAMTAAFELTSQPGWNDRYEVTVYQMGWRLGGKCATGRNPNIHNRIEEHGIHFLLGFYENAFHTIRHLYAEYLPNFPSPFLTWRDAFRNQDTVTAMIKEGENWWPFGYKFPRKDDLPGEDSLFGPGVSAPSPWFYLAEAVKWIEKHLSDLENQVPNLPHIAESLMGHIRALIAEDVRHSLAGVSDFMAQHETPPPAGHPGYAIISDFAAGLRTLLTPILQALEPYDRAKQFLILLDVGVAVVRGVIADGVLWNGFEAIDDQEFIGWLQSHHCHHADWAVIRAGLDACFGYLGGDASRPTMSAGVGLHGTFRLWFGYKGSIFWPMQAGMADVIFTPMYHVLKRRGVKFNFFHRVTNLGLSADGANIETIGIDVQARLRDPAAGYNPLVTVKGLDCWPHEPLFDQLENGEALRGYDLESAWGAPAPAEHKTLDRGNDFDVAVLGISLGAFPDICRELVAASPEWQTMVTRIPTVRTQALQLWLNKSAGDLGYDAGTGSPSEDPACVSSFVEPFDTYADMSALRDREDCGPGDPAVQLAYFCTVMKDDPAQPPHGTDPGYPARVQRTVKDSSIAFLEQNVGFLWPRAVAGAGTFDWRLLIAPDDQAGVDRFNWQYWRANIDPSARYVLSPPGGARYRLLPERSGFANLYLAGDWTYTPMNSGCVESATMSGLRAAQAILGIPFRIYDWHDHD